METQKRKKGGKKRITRLPLQSQTATTQWLGVPVAQLQPILAFQFPISPSVPPMLQPEKPLSQVLGELAGEIIWTALSTEWKKASPGSYALNRAIYEVAPHCGPEASGALNLGALITFAYGVKQIADTKERGD